MRRAVALGLVAVLASSSAVALSTGLPDGGRDEAPQPLLVVPTSRIGDEVEYAYRTAFEGSEFRSTTTYRFLGARTTIDWAGNVRQVVDVEDSVRYLDEAGNHAHARKVAIDLAARAPIEQTWTFSGGLQGKTHSHEWKMLGVNAPFDLPGLALQGKTLAPGDSVSAAPPAPPAAPIGVRGGTGGGGTFGVPGHNLWHEFDSRVRQADRSREAEREEGPSFVARGWTIFEGRQVMELVVRRTINADAVVPTSLESTLYLGSDHAYPLALLVNRTKGDETHVSELRLVRLQPGKQPIQWATTSSASETLVERSRQEAQVPDDGEDSRLAYPLSKAMGDTNRAATAPQFAKWRMEHPDARLVSAMLHEGSLHRNGQPVDRWNLVFAVPNGQAAEIIVERPRGSDLMYASDGQLSAVDPFDRNDLPSGPVTLASLEHAWRLLRSDSYAAHEPNFVRWGYELDSSPGLGCLLWTTSAYEHNRTAELKTAYVGYYNGGSCVEGDDAVRISQVVARLDLGVFFLYDELYWEL